MRRLRDAVTGGWRRGREWLARADLAVLLAVGTIVVAAWMFLALADAVTDGPPGHTDERLLRSLREPDDPADPLGPAWLEEAARDVTALGSYPVLGLLVAAVAGGLLATGHRSAALLVVASALGGMALSPLLKGAYARPRPELVPHAARVFTSSFPSGHAMLSAVVYLTLGAVLARLASRRRAKLFAVGTAVAVAGLVGLSRVYLGVHYPSDVLAGWCAGVAWAVTCWLAARRLPRRGAVEGDIR